MPRKKRGGLCFTAERNRRRKANAIRRNEMLEMYPERKNYRWNQSEEARTRERERQKIASANRRANETDEQRTIRLQKGRESAKRNRINQTPEQRAFCKLRERHRKQIERALETPEERELRISLTRPIPINETPEEKELRLFKKELLLTLRKKDAEVRNNLVKESLKIHLPAALSVLKLSTVKEKTAIEKSFDKPDTLDNSKADDSHAETTSPEKSAPNSLDNSKPGNFLDGTTSPQKSATDNADNSTKFFPTSSTVSQPKKNNYRKESKTPKIKLPAKEKKTATKKLPVCNFAEPDSDPLDIDFSPSDSDEENSSSSENEDETQFLVTEYYNENEEEDLKFDFHYNDTWNGWTDACEENSQEVDESDQKRLPDETVEEWTERLNKFAENECNRKIASVSDILNSTASSRRATRQSAMRARNRLRRINEDRNSRKKRQQKEMERKKLKRELESICPSKPQKRIKSKQYKAKQLEEAANEAARRKKIEAEVEKLKQKVANDKLKRIEQFKLELEQKKTVIANETLEDRAKRIESESLLYRNPTEIDIALLSRLKNTFSPEEKEQIRLEKEKRRLEKRLANRKSAIAAETPEETEARKRKLAATARLRIRMEKEELRIFKALTSAENPDELAKHLDDESIQNGITFWHNYKSSKRNEEVQCWRKSLYSLMVNQINFQQQSQTETPEGRTERMSKTFEDLKKLNSEVGEKVLEHLKFKRDYHNDFFRKQTRRGIPITEEQKNAKRERMNAYFRRNYHRKKYGIDIGHGGYVRKSTTVNSTTATGEPKQQKTGRQKSNKTEPSTSSTTDQTQQQQEQIQASTSILQNNSTEVLQQPLSQTVIQAHSSSQMNLNRDFVSYSNPNVESDNEDGWMPLATFEIDSEFHNDELLHLPLGNNYDGQLQHQTSAYHPHQSALLNQNVVHQQQSHHIPVQNLQMYQPIHSVFPIPNVSNFQPQPPIWNTNHDPGNMNRYWGPNVTQNTQVVPLPLNYSMQFLPNSQVNLISQAELPASSTMNFPPMTDQTRQTLNVSQEGENLSQEHERQISSTATPFKRNHTGRKIIKRKRKIIPTSGNVLRKRLNPNANKSRSILTYTYQKNPVDHTVAVGQKGPVKCPHCSSQFQTEMTCNIHIKSNHAPKTHSCTVCSKTFCSSKLLIGHIWRTHYVVDFRFNCPFCSKNLQTGSLDYHCKAFHPSESKTYVLGYSQKNLHKAPNYKCSLCMADFNTFIKLKEHFHTTHQNLKYVCQVCGLLITTPDQKHDHTQLFHPQQCDQSDNIQPQEVDSSSCCNCPVCCSSFLNKDFLKTHQKHCKENIDSDLIRCSTCKEGFITKSRLLKHSKNCTTKSHQNCFWCSEKFTSKDLRLQHIYKKHSEEKKIPKSMWHKPYKCELCTFSTYSIFKLRLHFNNTHFGMEHQINQSYSDGKTQVTSTKNPENLKETSNSFETQDANNKIDKSDTTTATISDVAQEVEIQQEEKILHTCPVCDKSFSSEGFHSHHKSYERILNKYCNICKKWLDSIPGYHRHMLEKHDINVKDKSQEEEKQTEKSTPVTLESDDTFICTICYKISTAEEFHKYHSVFELDADKRVCCKYCNKKFRTWKGVNYHTKAFHSNEINAKQTNKSDCPATSGTIRHITLASDPDPTTKLNSGIVVVHTCVSCLKHFKTNEFLKQHVDKEHGGVATPNIKPSCKICYLTFSDVGTFHRHRSKLHGEGGGKKYPCLYCPLLLSRQEHLRNHIKRAHGDNPKPLPLKNIPSTEATETNIKFQCEFCVKSFTGKYQLKHHLQTVHFPETLNSFCDFCGLQLHRIRLPLHYKTQHPGNEIPQTKVRATPNVKLPLAELFELVKELKNNSEAAEKGSKKYKSQHSSGSSSEEESSSDDEDWFSDEDDFSDGSSDSDVENPPEKFKQRNVSIKDLIIKPKQKRSKIKVKVNFKEEDDDSDEDFVPNIIKATLKTKRSKNSKIKFNVKELEDDSDEDFVPNIKITSNRRISRKTTRKSFKNTKVSNNQNNAPSS